MNNRGLYPDTLYQTSINSVFQILQCWSIVFLILFLFFSVKSIQIIITNSTKWHTVLIHTVKNIKTISKLVSSFIPSYSYSSLVFSNIPRLTELEKGTEKTGNFLPFPFHSHNVVSFLILVLLFLIARLIFFIVHIDIS